MKAKITQGDIDDYNALPVKEKIKAWESLKRLEAAGEIEPMAGRFKKPEGVSRKCHCPHGCDRECDQQARCPFCHNGGRGCPVLFHGESDPKQTT